MKSILFISARYGRYDCKDVSVVCHMSVVRHGIVSVPYQAPPDVFIDHHDHNSVTARATTFNSRPGWVFGLPPEGFEGE